MSGSSMDVVNEARSLLGDRDVSRSVLDPEDYRNALNRHASMVATDIGLGTSWVNPAFTTSISANEYNLSSAYDYDRIVSLVYASDGWPLLRVSPAEIADSQATSSGNAARHGRYCIRVNADRTLTVVLPGVSRSAEAVKMLYSTMPAKWTQQNSPVTLYMSEAALMAVALRVAASLARVSGADKITALDIASTAADSFDAEANKLVHQERNRIIDMKRARSTRDHWFPAWATS